MAVILLCDRKESRRNQKKRGGREILLPDKSEIEQFLTFKEKNFLPNALYLDQSRALTENFYLIAMAFRERCEDKGRCTLAGKITTESIDDFIQQNNSTFKNKA